MYFTLTISLDDLHLTSEEVMFIHNNMFITEGKEVLIRGNRSLTVKGNTGNYFSINISEVEKEVTTIYKCTLRRDDKALLTLTRVYISVSKIIDELHVKENIINYIATKVKEGEETLKVHSTHTAINGFKQEWEFYHGFLNYYELDSLVKQLKIFPHLVTNASNIEQYFIIRSIYRFEDYEQNISCHYNRFKPGNLDLHIGKTKEFYLNNLDRYVNDLLLYNANRVFTIREYVKYNTSTDSLVKNGYQYDNCNIYNDNHPNMHYIKIESMYENGICVQANFIVPYIE